MIVKMLKGKRYLDPDEMRRNFMGQAGFTGLTGCYLGVPDARQEGTNCLSAMEECFFILREQLIPCPQASGMRAEKMILKILLILSKILNFLSIPQPASKNHNIYRYEMEALNEEGCRFSRAEGDQISLKAIR